MIVQNGAIGDILGLNTHATGSNFFAESHVIKKTTACLYIPGNGQELIMPVFTSKITCTVTIPFNSDARFDYFANRLIETMLS